MPNLTSYTCPVCGKFGCVVGPAGMRHADVVRACPHRREFLPRFHGVFDLPPETLGVIVIAAMQMVEASDTGDGVREAFELLIMEVSDAL